MKTRYPNRVVLEKLIRKIHLALSWKLIFPFIFLVQTTLFSQNVNIHFDRITSEHGLPNNRVNAIIKDSKGFMWFGTNDGLFRYDGYRMVAYKHDRLDSTSLGNNNVFTILEDRSGKLWLGTAGGGLNRFDRETEQFVRFTHNPDDPNSISADVVSALYEDRSGAIWAGTWEGLNKIDPESGEITQFVYDPADSTSMSRHWINSIVEDSAGFLWIGTKGGLSRLDPDQGIFSHFTKELGSQYGVNTIYKDRSGTLWIGTLGSLNRFDTEHQHFTHFLNIKSVLSIYEDRSGTFWIGTSRGLYHFASIRDSQLAHEGEGCVGFKNYIIYEIYEDNTNTIWIASDHGVYRYDRGRHRFKHIIHDPNNSNSLSQNRVRSMYEDSTGAVWISTTDKDLNRYDPQTGQFQHSFPGLENCNLSSVHIYIDHSGMLWMGQGNGLGRYDPRRQQFMRFVHDPEDPYSLGDNNVVSIFEDRTGVLWVGTHHDGPGDLNRFDRQRQHFDHFDLTPKNTSGLGIGSGSVISISEGNSGRIWFATGGGGVCLFDRESETITRFTHIPGDPNSLSHGWVGVVHEDRQGILWAAPWYGGLNKLDPESRELTIYTEKDGLPSNYISSITEDDHGHLWLTTRNGLSRFDPYSKTFKNFDSHDGLLNTDFKFRNVSLKSRTGEVYFGGENGIDYVHPDSIRDNPYIPPVVFTRFTRYNSGNPNGKVIIEKGITEKQRFNLTYQDHTLTFEFAALNFRNPQKNQYAYKLEGFDDNWINLGNKHDMTFTNLDPGEYTLRVKGSNNDGIWNEQGASLVINISPPWWKTGWAYAIYIFTVLSLIYFMRRYELNRIHLKNDLKLKGVQADKLLEIDQLKSRFFANISHEFRTPLTLILGPVQSLISRIQDQTVRSELSLVQRNGQRLQRLINQLLDLSRIEAIKMRLQARRISLIPLLKGLVQSFATLAEDKNIVLKFNIPRQQIDIYLDVEKFETIITNLLSNAFKFTPEKGRIGITVVHKQPPLSYFMNRGNGEKHPPVSPLDRGDGFISPLEKGAKGGCLKISISNTGPGIPADKIDKIFDRFYQVDNTHKREHEGTGIGLALSKEFVELHHGEIRVESEPDTKTTFTVLLPLGKGHLKEDEIIEERKTGSRRQATGRDVSESGERKPETRKQILPISITDQNTITEIREKTKSKVQIPDSDLQSPLLLIVEDNPDMRAYMRGHLKDYYRIIEAENGVQGLAKAIELIPDLIISDVMMPDMDGFDLCGKLKTDQRTSHVPIILLTARASRDSKVEGLETGADDYLIKPFDNQELRVRVKNLIDQRRRLQERFRREVLIQPSEITVTSLDEAFLKKAITAVEAHMDDPAFETDDLARESAMSSRHLNRKLRALTGQSVREFIRTIRLRHAARLLQHQTGNVTEIAYQVGFQSIPHFAKVFREQFGAAPSEYLKKNSLSTS